MQTAKQEIEAMVRALPDDVTYEEAQYRLYVLEKIHKGLDSVEKNGVLAQEEVERRLQKWLIK